MPYYINIQKESDTLCKDKCIAKNKIMCYVNKMYQKLIRFIRKPHKVQRLYEKIINIPYIIRCKSLIRQVRNAPFEYGVSKVKRKQKIILSLTSYPARFSSIYLSLKSLLLQTLKPDKIILWLDCPENELSEEVKFFEQFGVDIRFVNSNLKPHTKYFYALQEYKDDLVITIDDDIIYPNNLIETLIDKHDEYPDCVCARRVHKKMYDKNQKLLPYNSWGDKYKKEKKPSYELMATGVGGVLYPPNALDSRAFDEKMIQKYSLNADDVWLHWMELLNGTKVVWVPNKLQTPPNTENSQETGLRSDNVENKRNDVYIKNMMNLFSEEINQKLNILN